MTGETHEKFVNFIRSEFGSSLLSGFTKLPSRFSKCCTWIHVAILTLRKL